MKEDLILSYFKKFKLLLIMALLIFHISLNIAALDHINHLNSNKITSIDSLICTCSRKVIEGNGASDSVLLIYSYLS